MNEIDPAITDLLERARPARPAAEDDWEDVLRRSRRGRRRRRFPVPTRGLLLAAAVIIGLAAAAQAETGVFQFVTDHKSNHPKLARHLRRLQSIDAAVYLGILSGLPHGVSRGISAVTWTSGAKMARTFGGTAAGYPRAAGVVVVRGPFSIPLYLQGCVEIPYACPVPIGDWAWLAYSVLPSPKTGPMSHYPNVRLLREAPSGTPLPQLAVLGHVTKEYVPPAHAYTVAREHQGTIVVVMHRGQALTEARVQCVYATTGYATPLCGALARYDAYLRKPHPNDAIPASGDWTRVSGTLGGWRGNLVITAERLSHAPARLRAAITNDLGATQGTPIEHVPPALTCIVNPNPCFHPVAAKIHAVLEILNRYGLDARQMPTGQTPARYRRLIPSGLHIEGAATNAGETTVATRGYVFAIVFDHTAPFSIRRPFLDMLGRNWGVFPDENVLTLYHPFYIPTLPRNFRHLKPIAMRRALHKMQADFLRHKRQDRVGELIIRGLDRLTTARGPLARITTFPAQP